VNEIEQMRSLIMELIGTDKQLNDWDIPSLLTDQLITSYVKMLRQYQEGQVRESWFSFIKDCLLNLGTTRRIAFLLAHYRGVLSDAMESGES
jgi:hypothetical protein